MSDHLHVLVEIILLTKGWSLQDWISCYNDLPNRQMKVKVNMSDHLHVLVEIILLTKGWSLQDWISCYNDLPNRQMKVKVNNHKQGPELHPGLHPENLRLAWLLLSMIRILTAHLVDS